MNSVKHLRLTMDFEIEISDITKETIDRYYRRLNNYEELIQKPESWETAARQNRLLLALLADPEALDRFLTFIVTNEVNPCEDSRLPEVFSVKTEDEIMQPLFSRLSDEDAAFFRDVSEAGFLWDNMEMVDDSFRVKWAESSIVELREVQRGSSGASDKINNNGYLSS